MSTRVTEFIHRGESSLQEKHVRSGLLDAIEELADELDEVIRERDNLTEKMHGMNGELVKLRSTVKNYEKLVSARDRFGCWLCAKHERESVEEDHVEEKEALRNENLSLRGEIKRLERHAVMMERFEQSSPKETRHSPYTRPVLRSSMRSSDTDSRDAKHIRFSRQSVSSDRPGIRGSVSSARPPVTKKVSLDAPPSPVHKKSPVISFASTALLLNSGSTMNAGARKSRSKRHLFTGSQSGAWAVKFTPTDIPLTLQDTDQLVTAMHSIAACDSESADDLRVIAAAMTPIRVAAGDTVCRQGEPGLFFMIIKSGGFLCEAYGSPSRDLKQFDFFGDEIFIHPAPLSSVSITCTSAGGGELWAIHTDALRHVLKQAAVSQYQLARSTLDCAPKILRDSINASQFASICKSASVVEGFSQVPANGVVVVIYAQLQDTLVPKGSVVLDRENFGRSVTRSQLLCIAQREVDSIPPLGVALGTLARAGGLYVPGETERPKVATESNTPTEEVSQHHPLSPSLRPNLSEADIASILAFSLLSISARTHLVNRAQFITLRYDDVEDPVELHLGIALVLNGLAVVSDGSKRVLLEHGQSAGLGQGTLSGRVTLDADRDVFELDDAIPPPVVVAYWPAAIVRAALPLTIRDELDEQRLISYLKKRKLLVRNPIFQFLSEQGIHDLIVSSAVLKLDHDGAVSTTVCSDQSVLVLDGSVLVAPTPSDDGWKLSVGDFFNSEALVDEPADELGSNKSEETDKQIVVTCHSVRAEMLVISKESFSRSFSTAADKSDILDRIHEYLKAMKERVELGDLKIGKTIGRGGTAVVKIATVPKEPEGPKYYALKIIKKKLLEKHNKLSMLKNEKFILQQLASPFVISLRATLKDTRHIYFLLELAPGGDLLTVLNVLGVLTRPQAQFYLACMVKALEHCHAHGIVYRDLKPENLLVDANGYVKLADFGVAKKLAKSGMSTYSLVGTPQFMAPEIILGKGYGMSADLWALGCCLFEFVVGELPFNYTDADENLSQLELFHSILQFRPEQVLFPPEVDDDTIDLITALLQADPHRRVGCSVGLGIVELERHRFFNPVKNDDMLPFSWEGLENHQLIPPFVPEIKPLSSVFVPDSASETGTDEVPTASPAMSAVSWTSFDHPRAHADTSLTWDLNF